MMFKYDQKKSQKQINKFNAFIDKANYFFIKYLPKYDELDSYILLLIILCLVISLPSLRNILLEIISKDLWKVIILLIILYNLIIGTYYTFKINETIPYNKQTSVTNINAFLITILTFFAFFYLHFDKILGNKSILNILLIIMIYYNFAKTILNAIIIYTVEDANVIKKIYYSGNNAKLVQIIIVTILIPFQTYINFRYINSLETFIIYTFSIYSITSLFAHFFNKQQINN
ncbi:MAG: hypothetical protein ACD_58C00120G0008 [uncultured bacterium]|nr:MAG: hypothetical protein ACD_58C00120G0008 [uncultured bacterium]